MSTKTIPAQEIMQCDRCGRESIKGSSADPFRWGGLHIKKANKWALGYDMAAGGISIDYDFCSDCSNEFDKWIQGIE